jgi:TPR repeat protein
MMLVQLIYWQLIISREEMVCCKIGQRRWNYGKKAATLGSSDAHYHLGDIYSQGGDLKKTKFHYEAAAMASHEVARYNLACAEYNSGNIEGALNHWIIAASAGGITPCMP